MLRTVPAGLLRRALLHRLLPAGLLHHGRARGKGWFLLRFGSGGQAGHWFLLRPLRSTLGH
ncbi:MAG TPA: hypothetical protein VFD82_16710 [Planctomycetota bacterium]|nr:hypothetical protein [Planctomycetota bacterium]